MRITYNLPAGTLFSIRGENKNLLDLSGILIALILYSDRIETCQYHNAKRWFSIEAPYGEDYCYEPIGTRPVC